VKLWNVRLVSYKPELLVTIIAWLKEQLEPYRTEQPEFTGAVDVKRWLICNWESDRFGDEFVQ
jgi:hypothetical protein